MIQDQLEELQTKFQGFFDEGLYPGLTNTQNRVEIGKITSIPRSPLLNIQFDDTERTPWATSNVDKVDNIFNLDFIIKPTYVINTDDRLKTLTRELNNFLSIFINEFIGRYKDNGENYFIARNVGSSELQNFDKNHFYISNKIRLTTYSQYL